MILIALLYLWFSKLMLIILPFKRIALYLGEPGQESSCHLSCQQGKYANQISRIFSKMDRYLRGKSKCLVQAMAAKWILNRRHIPTTLYLGTKPEPEISNGYTFHAWLRCGDVIVTGNKNISAFKILTKFGPSKS